MGIFTINSLISSLSFCPISVECIDETLCVVPEIAYGKYVKYIEWEFVNASNGEVIKLINPSNEPFIAPSEDKPLSPGYYNIKFKYSLNGDDVNEYQINSAFRKL